jgi:6-phosphogluconolactonase (cycloisomerase 2 family)
VHPSGNFAYVIYHPGQGAQGYVSEYSINSSTGALTAVGSVLPTGIEPYSVVVDPTGSFLYVANFTRSPSPGTVSAYSINKNSGALTYINLYLTGIDPSYIAIAKEPAGP